MKKHLQTILSLLCVLALALGTFTALAEGNVSKVITVKWSDGDNYDQIRPAQVKATLAGEEVILSEENGWTGEVSVPAGTDPSGWTFDAVDGYTATVSAGDITVLSLSHAVAPTTSVTGTVKWEDDNNAWGTRPASASLILLADGATYGEPRTVKPASWACTWQKVPQFAPNSDTRIAYSVKPLQVPEGYTASVSEDGLVVTFTYQTAELSLKAEVSGYPEGTDLSVLTVTVDGPDPSMPKTLSWAEISGGTYSFGKVVPGAYLVRGTNADTLVDGYTMDAENTQIADAVYVKAGESGTLTYKYAYKLPEAIDDVDTEYDPTANIGSLSFEILGPDDRMPIKVTYAEFTDGKYELDNLKPGTYTVVERNAEGLVKYYTLTGASVTGMALEVNPNGTSTCKLFNQYTPAPTPEPDAEFVDIPVTKTWNDSADKDGNRPDSITVRLYADGVEVDSHVLTAGENWTYTFSERPRYQEDNKTEIVYTVNEDDVPMYTKEINGYNLVNNYLPETTSQTVAKVWQDNDDKQGIRPASIAVSLSDGKKIVATVILNKENNWTATVNNLPTVVDGEKVTYTWTEQSVLGYKLNGVETKEGITTFYNAPWERPDEPTQGKKPKTPGEPYTTIDEYDTPLGVEVIINHVGDCYD